MEPHKILIMAQIYGIDLSQEKFDVSFRGKEQKNVHKIIKNNLNGIIQFLESLPKEALLCAEYTGVYGELLVFLCNYMHVPIALAPGYQIRHSLGLQKGKSDKIDAIRIREYGERFGDKLVAIDYPEENIKELRELFGLRSQLVKERKMLQTHQKRMVHMAFNSLKTHQITKDTIAHLTTSIKDIEREIMGLIDGNFDIRRNYKLITDIIGIGQITACELIVKTDNFKTINTSRKAASYAGVCPFPNSSGKMVGKSRVNHMSDKELKSLLYMCSIAAARLNPEYRLYFERKKIEGKPYFLIMNNISNKLLRTIYGVVKSGKRYELGYITTDPRLKEKVA